jgi:hypothetical protein
VDFQQRTGRRRHLRRRAPRRVWRPCLPISHAFFALRGLAIRYQIRYRKLEKIDWIDFGALPKMAFKHANAVKIHN